MWLVLCNCYLKLPFGTCGRVLSKLGAVAILPAACNYHVVCSTACQDFPEEIKTRN